jgi:hypothetical protein
MRRGSRERLVGAWKLVSYVEKPVDGSAPFYPHGRGAAGHHHDTPDGYMPAQLMHLSRPLSSLRKRTAKPLGFPSRASKVDAYRF